MCILSLVALGLLGTGIVFVVDASMRDAGIRRATRPARADIGRLEYFNRDSMCGAGDQGSCVGLGRPVSFLHLIL